MKTKRGQILQRRIKCLLKRINSSIKIKKNIDFFQQVVVEWLCKLHVGSIGEFREGEQVGRMNFQVALVKKITLETVFCILTDENAF